MKTRHAMKQEYDCKLTEISIFTFQFYVLIPKKNMQICI